MAIYGLQQILILFQEYPDIFIPVILLLQELRQENTLDFQLDVSKTEQLITSYEWFRKKRLIEK